MIFLFFADTRLERIAGFSRNWDFDFKFLYTLLDVNFLYILESQVKMCGLYIRPRIGRTTVSNIKPLQKMGVTLWKTFT